MRQARDKSCKSSIYSSYQTTNPFRSPKWRYERALSLYENKKKPLVGVDDQYVSACRAFLIRWNKIHTLDNDDALYEAKLRLYLKYPDLMHAFEIFERNDSTRIAIEARLLAGQNNRTIALKAGTTREAIAAFEALFFNVRDRLANKDYIVQQVIKPLVIAGLAGIANGLSAKFFGYFGGPIVLDQILDGYDHSTMRPHETINLNDYFDKHWEAQIRRRSAETISALGINQFNAFELLNIHQKLIEQAKNIRGDSVTKTNVEENINVLLTAIPWSVGTEGRKRVAKTPLAPYANKSGELRVDEMYALLEGKELPGLDSELDTKLPKPKAQEEREAQLKQYDID